MIKVVALAAVLLTAFDPVASETCNSQLTGGEIVDRMIAHNLARSRELREYTSLRRYWLEDKRLGIRAQMTVKATYRSHADQRFDIIEESGPPAVRKKVFHRMLDSEIAASREDAREGLKFTPSNYAFSLLGSEMLDGRPSFILELNPITKNPLLLRGRIWVDSEDFAVTRIEASPAKNPSMWIQKVTFTHQYGKFGPFWLAVSNVSETDLFLLGHAQLRIEYSDYVINPDQTPAQIGPVHPSTY
jgi:hypothetical protein